MGFEEPKTIEEDLELISKAIEMGIDPFLSKREKRKWGRIALASFMSYTCCIMDVAIPHEISRVAPSGFEPGSWHPECHMMDHYTKGL